MLSLKMLEPFFLRLERSGFSGIPPPDPFFFLNPSNAWGIKDMVKIIFTTIIVISCHAISLLWQFCLKWFVFEKALLRMQVKGIGRAFDCSTLRASSGVVPYGETTHSLNSSQGEKPLSRANARFATELFETAWATTQITFITSYQIIKYP